MKSSFIIIIFYICNLNVFSQNGIQWKLCLGGTENDAFNTIEQTSDGGFILVGSTASNNGDISGNHGSSDVLVVKTNGSGIIQWKKCFGGSNDDYGNSTQETSDSGFIVACRTSSIDGDVIGKHGQEDAWIFKLNNNGIILWQKCLGGSGFEWPNSIKQTSDGGFIFAGRTSSNDGDVVGNHGINDAWIVKLNNIGNIQWQKCFGGSEEEYANTIIQSSDSNYIIAGRTNSDDGDIVGNHGLFDIWILKVNSIGGLIWQKCFGGSGVEDAYSIEQTTDNGLILAGNTNSIDGDVVGNHGVTDSWILKLDSLESIQWQKCLGGSGGEWTNCIKHTLDGNYVLGGWSSSNDGDVSGNHGSGDAWILKINNSGGILWQKCFGGSSDDQVNSILQTDDGGYITSGGSSSNDGDVIGNHGRYDAWIMKLYSVVGIDEIQELTKLIIYPVPTNDELNIEYTLSTSTNIKLEIKNMLLDDLLQPVSLSNHIGFNSNTVSISKMPNGVYLLKLTTHTGSMIKKVLVKH